MRLAVGLAGLGTADVDLEAVMGLLTAPLDLSKAFTNEFLP